MNCTRHGTCLNTLFVRYGCGTKDPTEPGHKISLNTLFVRYGCGTDEQYSWVWGSRVLIPYSSGMGVGPVVVGDTRKEFRLNTLFVRYGCGTQTTKRLREKQKS